MSNITPQVSTRWINTALLERSKTASQTAVSQDADGAIEIVVPLNLGYDLRAYRELVIKLDMDTDGTLIGVSMTERECDDADDDDDQS